MVQELEVVDQEFPLRMQIEKWPLALLLSSPRYWKFQGCRCQVFTTLLRQQMEKVHIFASGNSKVLTFLGLCMQSLVHYGSAKSSIQCARRQEPGGDCAMTCHLKAFTPLEEVSSCPLFPTTHWHARGFQKFSLSFSCLSLTLSLFLPEEETAALFFLTQQYCRQPCILKDSLLLFHFFLSR